VFPAEGSSMASLLVLTVLLPLVGSLILIARPQLSRESARSLALGSVLATLGFSLVLLAGFQPDATGPQFAFENDEGKYGLDWMPRFGVRFALGLDGISLWLFGLTSLLMLTAVFSSWESVKDRAATHYGLLLAVQASLLGLFASLDVVLFYTFFEFTLIPLFFLIGLYGGPDRRRASVTFFLYTLAGSLLTLLGVIALVAIHYQHTPNHILTFSIPELTEGLKHLNWDEWTAPRAWSDWRAGKPFWSSPQVLVFLLLFAGFAIKIPLFPFHTWQPLTYVEAPMAGTILLAGVVGKIGTYGFLRFNMAMTPIGSQALAPLMGTLAVISILYGALAALAQVDVKRLIAYSSMSHLGFIVLGMFSLNATGMDGAVIQMFNHGLTTGALFACVGLVQERYQSKDMEELGGLWNRQPLWAFFIILASLASAGLPGLNGFIGEFPILLGMFRSNPTLGVLASLGMILGAYYLLVMLQKFVFGPLRVPSGQSNGEARPVAWYEIAGLTPLMVLIVLIGIVPKPFLDRIQPPLVPIVAELRKTRSAPVVANQDAKPVPTPAASFTMIGD
jgi:NADH-quinone oxidoreductase subunit M